jgi:Putative MetA-pathway of phenol degradation
MTNQLCRRARPLPLAVCATTLLIAALSSSAHAHHPGASGNTGGTGPINTISATTLPPGMTAVAVTYEYTALSGLNDAGLVAAVQAGEHAHSIASIASPAATFAYGLTGDLMLSVRLPYVTRRDMREAVHGHEEEGHDEHGAEVASRGDSDGIGDASLLAQWRVLNNLTAGTSAALLMGVKAPTGRTGQIDQNGELFEPEFQAGSGSWDGMFGLALTQRLGAWSFDGNVLYTAVSRGEMATRLGDRFHYNAAVSYRVMGGALGAAAMKTGAHHQGGHDHDSVILHDHTQRETTGQLSLDLVLELNGEWHDKQDISGAIDSNSGGNVVYISPGVRLSMDQWSGFASVGVPVINDLNGLQSEADVRVVSGVAVSF